MTPTARAWLSCLMVAFVAALAACQPVPRPFQGVAPPDPKLLSAPDFGGVVVLPVRDAPEPAATLLAHELAAALTAAEITATTGAPNQRSALLEGRIVDPGNDAHILWELRARDGTLLASERQPIEGMPVLPWARGEDWLMRDLANDVAPLFAALLGAPDAAGASATVRLLPVTGAPGDGNQALVQAIAGALRLEELMIARTPEEAAVGVAGQVVIEPGPAGAERITIVWLVRDPVGAEIGRITQTNTIPAGSLNGPWGQTAEIVAMAAAPEIADLARRFSPDGPARPAIPVAAPPAPRPADGVATGEFRLQLAALSTSEQARRAADEIAARHPQLVRGMQFSVLAAATDRGTVYRVLAGPARDQVIAQGLCRQFRDAGQDCIVVGY